MMAEKKRTEGLSQWESSEYFLLMTAEMDESDLVRVSDRKGVILIILLNFVFHPF